MLRLALLFVSLFVLATSAARADTPPILLDPIAEQLDLSGRMALLHDPGGQLTISAVSRRGHDFQTARRADLVRSFNAGTFWLRFTLHNTTAENLMRWMVVGHPRIQNIEVFVPSADGTVWSHMQSGALVPRNKKPVQALDAVFPLTVAAGQRQEVFVRIHSETAIDMASSLWIPEAYRRTAGESRLLTIFMMGGVLLGALLSFVVFAVHRETPYLWLGLLQASDVALEAIREGLLAAYLWPANLPFYPQILLLAACGAIFSMASLVTSSLPSGLFPGHSRRLVDALKWAAVLVLGLGLWRYGQGIRLLSVIAVLLMPVCLALSIIIYRRGFLHARFLAYGLFLTWGMETLRQLANLGILPIPWAMHLNTSAGMLFATPLILMGLIARTGELAEQLLLSHKVNQAKSEFLARVNHELRSPLNTIIGFARMLNRQSRRLTLAEGTAGIEQNSRRLLGMIDELLDESRLRSGRLSLQAAPLPLAPWWQSLRLNWEINAEQAGNHFICKHWSALDGMPACVLADGQRLRQVLDNLLSNANRHTEAGRIELSLSATPGKNPDQVILDFAVSDTGQGISPEHLAHIFEPFFRGDAPKCNDPQRRSGFGMGLSITRELLRMMGSEITVSSTLGQGSSFRFSLTCPLADMPSGQVQENTVEAGVERIPEPMSGLSSDPTPAPEPGPDPTTARPIAARQGLPLRVLLVEDDESARLMLEDLLESMGHATHATPDGETAIAAWQALAHAHGAPWDMVITDQRMPNGDGWAVLRHMRRAAPEIPVILLTAETVLPPDGYPHDIQFDRILFKPADTEMLAAAINGVQVEKRLHRLLHLIGEGEITEIESGCAALLAHHPDLEPLTRSLLSACHRLDFPAMQAMSEDMIRSLITPAERH